MSDRLSDLDDTPRPVDPVFRDALRAELLATVTATPGKRLTTAGAAGRRRSWRRPAALTMLVMTGLAGSGAVAVASGLVHLPGADQVVVRSRTLDVVNAGTATVDLGTAPAGATHVELTFTCLDPGTFTVDDGASATCSREDTPAGGPDGGPDGDAGDPPASGTSSWSQPLGEVESGVTVTTTPGTRWTMTRTFSTRTPTEWGVNADGETYGVAKADGSTPDLVAVEATNGEQGYAHADELSWTPDFATREEALAWQEAGSTTPPVTVYASDGTTVVGTFDNGSDR